MTRPVSGEQYEIAGHGYEAVVASVGASLRVLRRDGRDLVVPFEADEPRPALRGAILAPWPNRLADGRYRFDGGEFQLPVNEPETGNAAHGLVTDLDFGLAEHGETRVLLRGRIEPQPGYAWRVRVDVESEIRPDGFHQTISATNESDSSAPVGLGAHPYVLAGSHGEAAIDEWILHSSAREALLVSPDRLLPVASADVAAYDSGALDFRSPRRIGATVLNHAFTGLDADEHGKLGIALSGAEGHTVEVGWDADSPWVQLYTADHQPGDGRRHGLAIEPMTCPPDSFNSGRDLRVLGPGETTSLAWRLRVL